MNLAVADQRGLGDGVAVAPEPCRLDQDDELKMRQAERGEDAVDLALMPVRDAPQ